MTLPSAWAKYLTRRAESVERPLEGVRHDSPSAVVVIPVLAERNALPATLQSLSANEPESQAANTQVILVVNNRTPEHAGADDISENQAMLDDLRSGLLQRDLSPLSVAWVDASSPGLEIGHKQGVGTARKVGMDWGLRCFEDGNGVFICLDADTRVEPNYFDAIHDGLQSVNAAVIDYAHDLPEDPKHRDAMLAYESHLRCHILGLRHAGSPYGIHTLGSAIACTADAYVAANGMSTYATAEDFYFVQSLIKTGVVAEISTTTVHPSSRVSQRAPFGTGPSVAKLIDGNSEATTYNPKLYSALRDWLGIVNNGLNSSAEELLDQANTEVAIFLRGQDFAKAWHGITANHAAPDARHRAFHTWFDGLRTLRMLHHLRDASWPDFPLSEALNAWLPDGDGESLSASLSHLRNIPLPAQVTIMGSN